MIMPTTGEPCVWRLAGRGACKAVSLVIDLGTDLYLMIAERHARRSRV